VQADDRAISTGLVEFDCKLDKNNTLVRKLIKHLIFHQTLIFYFNSNCNVELHQNLKQHPDEILKCIPRM
jgi:hypothetical protein